MKRGELGRKKERRMDKKAYMFGLETTIFIVLNIMFFVIVIFFIRGSGNNDLIYEQTYAKQIALFIDNAKPGTEINLDVSNLLEIAKNNHFNGNVVMIDNINKRIRINLVEGRGYSYGYFTNSSIVWDLKKEEGRLVMGVR